MPEPGDTLLRRFSFIFFGVLVAANLVLVSINLAKVNGRPTSFAQLVSIPASAKPTANHLHTVLFGFEHAIASGVRIPEKGLTSFGTLLGHGFESAGKETLLNYFIQPADYADVPVISPEFAEPVATATQATVSPPTPVKYAAATQPAQRTVTVAASPPTPASQIDAIDPYAWGNCTWWAYLRRAQVNDPIPGSWGNAATWAVRAAADGYVVDHHPTPGAIMQTPDSAGGLGHVAFVESVDSDGTWHISEMNVLGLNIVDRRTESAAAAANYNFIHDKS